LLIHYLQHVPFEGLGSIAEWANAKRCPIAATRLYAGEPLPDPAAFGALVVLGGPMGVGDELEHPWLRAEKRFLAQVIERQVPVLGICLGAQLLAEVLGARVYPGPQPEIGWWPIELTEEARRSPLFRGAPTTLEAFHWHADTFDLPGGAVRIARSEAFANQGFLLEERIVGLQFHLETTPAGAEALVQNAAADLVEGAYVQGAAEMLAGAERFRAIHALMDRLLDGLLT
jgi:GMP synthase (glutamine-hydrolysing)